MADEIGFIGLGNMGLPMTEQLLNTPQIGATVKHVRCKAMPQRMRADCRIKPGHFKILVHLAPDATSAQPPAVLVHEQDSRIKVAVVLRPLVPVLHIMLYDLQSRRADRSNSFLLAFASDMNDFAKKIDIVHVQRYQFADSDAGTVKRLQDGPVSCTQPGIHRRRAEQPLYLFVLQETRQLLLLLRRPDCHHRIRANVVSLDQEFVEAPQRCELARNRGLGIFLVVQVRQVSSHRIYLHREKQLVYLDPHLRRHGNPVFRLTFVMTHRDRLVMMHFLPRCAFEKFTELRQVGTITLGRMLREPSFEFQVIEELLDNRTFVHNVPICLFHDHIVEFLRLLKNAQHSFVHFSVDAKRASLSESQHLSFRSGVRRPGL